MYGKFDIINLFDNTEYWEYHGFFGDHLWTCTEQRVTIIQRNEFNTITSMTDVYNPDTINVISGGREQEFVELEFMREDETLCSLTINLWKLEEEMLEVRLVEYPSCKLLESRTLKRRKMKNEFGKI